MRMDSFSSMAPLTGFPSVVGSRMHPKPRAETLKSVLPNFLYRIRIFPRLVMSDFAVEAGG
jgi:hypothetical protein